MNSLATDDREMPAEVFHAFERVDPTLRATLFEMRKMIFDVAQDQPRVGPVEETLRWGEPAYITTKRRTGSTIRLGVEKTTGRAALFFNCQTSLVEEFRQKFSPALCFVKNRAIVLDDDWAENTDALKMCIAAALTYHL